MDLLIFSISFYKNISASNLLDFVSFISVLFCATTVSSQIIFNESFTHNAGVDRSGDGGTASNPTGYYEPIAIPEPKMRALSTGVIGLIGTLLLNHRRTA